MPPANSENELLRILVEGTAATSGDEFFKSLVKNLTTLLGVRYAFVAEFADAPSTVRTLSFWGDDELKENIEYELAGTPCEEVVNGDVCHYPDNVAAAFPTDQALTKLNVASYLGVPMRDASGLVLGHLAIMHDQPLPDKPRNLAIFRIFATRARTEMLRLRAEQQLEQANEILEAQVAERTKELSNALEEVKLLQKRLRAENLYLQDEIKTEYNFEEIIGSSPALDTVLSQVEQVASTIATVLILGESGTGKELIARAIHNLSDRRERPLVKVNCAALPANLIESELFGHEKGSFTGAVARKIGRFELADGGTIFLDEIGELPVDLQVKLLRVLQEQEFERLGSAKTIHVDIRVIAATNRDLPKAVAAREFREDLFYRLNVFPLIVPPLRQRKSDIPLLVNAFTKRFARQLGKTIETVPTDVIEAFQSYPWPGNIRELQNVIQRSVILSPGKELQVDQSLSAVALDTVPMEHVQSTLEEVERQHIQRTLEEVNWKISGVSSAAEVLGLNPSTLRARIRKLGIQRSDA